MHGFFPSEDDVRFRSVENAKTFNKIFDFQKFKLLGLKETVVSRGYAEFNDLTMMHVNVAQSSSYFIKQKDVAQIVDDHGAHCVFQGLDKKKR